MRWIPGSPKETFDFQSINFQRGAGLTPGGSYKVKEIGLAALSILTSLRTPFRSPAGTRYFHGKEKIPICAFIPMTEMEIAHNFPSTARRQNSLPLPSAVRQARSRRGGLPHLPTVRGSLVTFFEASALTRSSALFSAQGRISDFPVAEALAPVERFDFAGCFSVVVFITFRVMDCPLRSKFGLRNHEWHPANPTRPSIVKEHKSNSVVVTVSSNESANRNLHSAVITGKFCERDTAPFLLCSLDSAVKGQFNVPEDIRNFHQPAVE